MAASLGSVLGPCSSTSHFCRSSLSTSLNLWLLSQRHSFCRNKQAAYFSVQLSWARAHSVIMEGMCALKSHEAVIQSSHDIFICFCFTYRAELSSLSDFLTEFQSWLLWWRHGLDIPDCRTTQAMRQMLMYLLLKCLQMHDLCELTSNRVQRIKSIMLRLVFDERSAVVWNTWNCCQDQD